MESLLIEAAADFGRRLVQTVTLRAPTYGGELEDYNTERHLTLLLEVFASIENNPFESYEQYKEAIKLSSLHAGLLQHERIHAAFRMERAGWLPIGSNMQSRVYIKGKELLRTDREHPEGILS
jgi:hypothetical protein